MLLPPNAKRFTFWAVLGAGIFLGAAAASGHATSPPGVNDPGTTAGQASVAPDASLHNRLSAASNAAPGASTTDALNTPTGTRLAEPAQKALSTPASPSEDALVFMDSPKPAQQSTQGHTPTPTQENSTRFAMLLLLVFGLLGVALAVAHYMKKGMGNKSQKGPSLELVDSLRIAGKWHISLVRAPGRLLVIGAADGEVSLLADLDEEDEHPGLLADTLVDLPSLAPTRRNETPQVATRPVETAPRPAPVQAAPAPTQAASEEDPFFDALLQRMNARQPEMKRSIDRPSPVDDQGPAAINGSLDEMDAIRARIAAYERRNALLA
ncbi:MAG: hypothetical protein CL940_00345 [Deltaproteobacteria bacterium]|nr:hypothetical protein [Deltaproteobacteria bacterium]